MLRGWAVFLTAMSLTLAVSAAAAPTQASSGPSRYVVVLAAGTDVNDVAAKHGRRYGVQVEHVYRAALRGYSAVVPASSLARLADDPAVAFVAADKQAEALGKPVTAPQQLPMGVDRIDGDTSTTRSGDGIGTVSVPIAILDTGSGPHADLNIIGGTACIGRNF